MKASACLFSILLWLLPMALPAAPEPLPESPGLQAIQARGVLRVGFEVGYMPFEMRDRSGDIIGFDVDLSRLLARRLGVKLEMVNIAWDGIIPALLTDKFDILIAGMTITEERAKRVAFTDPYMELGQTVLINRALAKSVHSHADLNDPRFRIVSKLGTTGEIAARKVLPRASLRTFESESDAVIEVRSGRADGFVYDLTYNLIMAAQQPESLAHLSRPFTQEKLAFAVRQNDPGMVAWLNGFLRDIRADGTYAALVRKWFENDAWMANVTGP